MLGCIVIAFLWEALHESLSHEKLAKPAELKPFLMEHAPYLAYLYVDSGGDSASNNLNT